MVPPYVGCPFWTTVGVPGTRRSPLTAALPLSVTASALSCWTEPSTLPLRLGAWRTRAVPVWAWAAAPTSKAPASAAVRAETKKAVPGTAQRQRVHQDDGVFIEE